MPKAGLERAAELPKPPMPAPNAGELPRAPDPLEAVAPPKLLGPEPKPPADAPKGMGLGLPKGFGLAGAPKAPEAGLVLKAADEAGLPKPANGAGWAGAGPMCAALPPKAKGAGAAG